MSVHQCPKCELRFDWKTELDDHCWHDHPEFRHEYPASAPPPEPKPDHPVAQPTTRKRLSFITELGAWMLPRRSTAPERDHLDHLS